MVEAGSIDMLNLLHEMDQEDDVEVIEGDGEESTLQGN